MVIFIAIAVRTSDLLCHEK